MVRFNKWGVVAIAAVGVLAFGSAVVAQDKTAAVKDRQAFMKVQADDNKVIVDYSKGAATKEAATKAIDDLLMRSGKIQALFVPGTSSTDLPGVSNAKAAIWTDKDKFAAIIVALHDAEVKTAAVIKTGTPDEAGASRGDIGKAGCGACHGTFREKLPG